MNPISVQNPNHSVFEDALLRVLSSSGASEDAPTARTAVLYWLFVSEVSHISTVNLFYAHGLQSVVFF